MLNRRTARETEIPQLFRKPLREERVRDEVECRPQALDCTVIQKDPEGTGRIGWEGLIRAKDHQLSLEDPSFLVLWPCPLNPVVLGQTHGLVLRNRGRLLQ